ncbi:hypothetical protein PLESTB_000344000 [Pleodorina starrii]|uniref:Erythromycin biosynthesis protein CIII-like C-terminal domain-containing protein n=1 Tax=Pleodorina starrii TaxID=330485 RepID=A0A9W6BDN6_9CHLO|nr:hypothetical protein PLESTB_000344000 [Pleodorina starrii]GLC73101.1 hypothetical protein PLESTF_001332300 [Pleodorina starrii]
MTVSFITHSAHSTWLESSIYGSLHGKEYVDSPPAGGCWSPAGRDSAELAAAPAAAAAKAPAASRISPEDSLARPDARVVEAICNRIAAAAATAAAGAGTTTADMGACTRTAAATAARQRPLAGEQPPTPGACVDTEGRTLPLSLTQLRERLEDTRLLLGQLEQQQQQQQQQKQQQAGGGQQQLQNRQQQEQQERSAGQLLLLRHQILFNLFALEAYHAAEALGLPCTVAAPYMIPYRCPVAFWGMFRRELPELYDTLRRAAELQQQAEAEAEGLGAPAAAAEAEAAEAAGQAAEAAEAQRANLSRVTFAEVVHWMWPLFTERWGEWRSSVLGLPPLPFHRHCPKPPGPGGGPASPAEPRGEWADSTSTSTSSPCDDLPLPLDCLPPAPPLLYGFSDLLVPRPSYWPRSVEVCGFWQPPLEWFAGERLPDELAALPLPLPLAAPPTGSGTVEGTTAAAASVTDAATEAPWAPPPPPLSRPVVSSWSNWCLVDFGSSGRLGLIPQPLATLELLDRVLARLGMAAIVLTAGWQPLHQAAVELQRRKLDVAMEAPGAAAGATAAATAAAEGAGGAPCVADIGASSGSSGAARAPVGAAASAASPGITDSGFTSQQAGKRGRAASCGDLEEAADAADGSPVRLRRRQVEQTPWEEKGREDAVQREGAAGPCVGSAGPPLAAAANPIWALRLHLYGGDVAHQLVLPYCRLVLHHAGSGTTAAALQCGVPQVTCPLHFDQHFWAERLGHLGLSPPPLDRDLLFGSPAGIGSRAEESRRGPDDPRVAVLTAVLRDALEPSRLAVARAMAQDLAAEGGGLQAAARALLRGS